MSPALPNRASSLTSLNSTRLCKLLGESVSRNIERISYAKRLNARKLINTEATEANPSGFIVAKSEDLLSLFDADFGVLSIGDEAKVRWEKGSRRRTSLTSKLHRFSVPSAIPKTCSLSSSSCASSSSREAPQLATRLSADFPASQRNDFDAGHLE